MKITEVSQPTDRALLESIEADNNTGFLAEDLAKIYRTHQADNWESVQYDDLIDELERLKDLDRNDE